MAGARYDGLAEWYDREQARVAARPDAPLERFADLAGPADGQMVEVGCGTGLAALALRKRGWTVGGLDLSADQLTKARDRCDWVVRADAHHLPFRTASVPSVGVAFVHTDVDSIDEVVREIARVLVPNGFVAWLGVHPCFVGHHVDSPTKNDHRRGIVAGYRDSRWVRDSEQFGPGIRSRVGARHVPLGELVTAFIDARLQLDRMEELGSGIVPIMLGIRAHKAP